MCSAILFRITDIFSTWSDAPDLKGGGVLPFPPVLPKKSQNVVLSDAAGDAGSMNPEMSTLCSLAILRTSGDDR